MTIDILAPIHTYPDGNSEQFALHVAAIARHLDANVHALILNADFPSASNALGNILIDIPSLIRGAKAQSRDRGAAFLQAMESEVERLGISLRTTEVECFEGCCQSNRNLSPICGVRPTRASAQAMSSCHSARAAERRIL